MRESGTERAGVLVQRNECHYRYGTVDLKMVKMANFLVHRFLQLFEKIQNNTSSATYWLRTTELFTKYCR